MTLAPHADPPTGTDGLPQVWCELQPGGIGQWANYTTVLDGSVTFPLLGPGWYNRLDIDGQPCPINGHEGVTLHVVSNLTLTFEVSA